MAKFKVLSTKLLDASQRELAIKNDIELVEQEMIRLEPLLMEEVELPSGPDLHMVFTSASAVETLDAHLKRKHKQLQGTISCLSGRTKAVLLESSLASNPVIAEGEDAAQLAEAIKNAGVRSVHFFCGNKRRESLPEILNVAGINVKEIVLYETIATPVTVDGDFDCILFFSPSAVESFFSANQLKEDTVCFAIGKTTAESLAAFTKNRVITSKSPRQESLMSALLFYLQTRPSAEANTPAAETDTNTESTNSQ